MSTSRNFGKIPGNAYKPGFIDTKSQEMMKMSVDRELSEISKAFYKTDETVATKENSIYKGKWNPSSGSYPDANYENSWWDVETPNDTDYSFNGKIWRSFQKLIYDKSTLSYRLVEDWASAVVKERIEKLEVSSGDASAAIQELERVMVAEDAALAERITNLSAHVSTQNAVLDAKIEDYNTVQSNATSALASKVTTVETEYKAADTSLNAAIVAETTARTTADQAIASSVTNLTATVTTNKNTQDSINASQADKNNQLDSSVVTLTASISSEATARADADSALATQINTVEAEYKVADTGLKSGYESADAALKNGYEAADAIIRASVVTETDARASADNALASQITTVKSELEGDIASVQTYSETNITRVDGNISTTNSNLATTNSNLSTTNNNVTALGNRTTAIEAKWGVRVNVNGKVTGISLNNDGYQTSFAVQADQFTVSDGTSNTIPPFEIVGGNTRIKSAFINTLQSDTWDGVNNGWAITKDGYANFQNVTVRGNLNAVTFTGVGGSGNTFSCSSRSKITTGQVITLESFSINQALQQNSFILVNRPMIVIFGFGRVFLRLRRRDTNAIVASGYGMNYLSNINDGVSVNITLSGSLPAGFSGTLELEGYMDNSHGLGSGAWQADGGSSGDWTVYRAV